MQVESATTLATADSQWRSPNAALDKKEWAPTFNWMPDLSPEFLLFHEGPSRIIVSTGNPEAVLAAARKNSIEAIVVSALH